PVFGGSNSITGVNPSYPSDSNGYALGCGTNTGTGSCNEDGFATNPAGAAYNTHDGSPGHPTTVTFTFANTLVAGLTASDLDVPVTYRGSWSGWVDGTLKGSATSSTNCSATPVPEPITMFLGGTGLLALAYAGRKRLHTGFTEFAS